MKIRVAKRIGDDLVPVTIFPYIQLDKGNQQGPRILWTGLSETTVSLNLFGRSYVNRGPHAGPELQQQHFDF